MERRLKGLHSFANIFVKSYLGYSHLNKVFPIVGHLSERVPFTAYSTESPSPKYIYITFIFQ